MATPSTDLSKYDLTDDTSAISPAYAAGLIRALLANGTAQGTWDGFDLSDTSSVVTPKYAARAIRALMQQGLPPIHLLTRVIGVCDDGTRSAHGMELKWIDEDYNDIESLPDDFFDTHPSWQFPSYDIGGSFFNKIPIAYTKRGYVPYGENAGKWYMMLSPTPRDGFEPHYTAFTYKGVLKDCFYWGTYRAFNDNGKPGSQPNKAHWKNVSWQAFWDAAVSLGDGYHMGSLQEYHEILMRAVIEKKTFNLWPFTVCENYQQNHYRGIEEMAYNSYGDDRTNGTKGEWRSGVRTDANKQIEVFDTYGDWGYVNTGKSPQVSGSPASLLTGTYFDHMFMAETGATSIEQIMIPNANYTTGTSGVACSAFDFFGQFGAFYLTLDNSASSTSAFVGSRLAYIDPDSVYEP